MVVVAAGLVALAITSAVGFFAFPVFQDALLEEQGWSLTRASFAIVVHSNWLRLTNTPLPGRMSALINASVVVGMGK